MWDLIRSIFLASLLRLTPHPVSLNGAYTLRIEPPVTALTARAQVELKLTSKTYVDMKPQDVEEIAKRTFSSAQISAEVVESKTGRKALFRYMGRFAWDKEGLILLIEPTAPVPTNAKFNFLSLQSNVGMESVLIYWKNTGTK